jgi:transaldolase
MAFISNRIKGYIMKIYADGSDINEMLKVVDDVDGFTTNPTLMRKAGVKDYEAFVQEVVSKIELPVSFEVFADDFGEMERQARKLAAYADNIYVKIPVSNTKGEPSYDLINTLAEDGIKQNVTAIFTLSQIDNVIKALGSATPSIISIFAGRIADTGVDPVLTMQYALDRALPNQQILWASCREIFNIYEAEAIGCHIITVPPDMISKASALALKDLSLFSRETVQMFYDDATASGYIL